MTRTFTKETDRFTVETPFGERLVVIEFTTFPEGATDGVKRIKTFDGLAVKLISPGEYKLLDGTRLRRVAD